MTPSDLPRFNAAVEKTRARCEGNVKHYEDMIAGLRKQADTIERKIREMTELWLQTGVAYYADAFADQVQSFAGIRLKDYFKEMAGGMGRPCLLAVTYSKSIYVYGAANPYQQSSWIEMRVPSNKRMENIFAPLVMVAEPYENNSKACTHAGPVARIDNKFFFPGAVGKEHFESFLDTIRNDRATQIIMGV